MPTLRADDGVELYYEEAGSGTPLVFRSPWPADLRPALRLASGATVPEGADMLGYLQFFKADE